MTRSTAASDLDEQVSKYRSVLRRLAGARSSLGADNGRCLRHLGAGGARCHWHLRDLFAVGVAPEQAAELSRALVELAADLASFNNSTPEDVLIAIRSGLVGEAEPLRRYGILLSETRVAQVALANSGKENVKELTLRRRHSPATDSFWKTRPGRRATSRTSSEALPISGGSCERTSTISRPSSATISCQP